MFIGDFIPFDIDAPQRIGMKALLIDRLKKVKEPPEGLLVIESMMDFIKNLKSI